MKRKITNMLLAGAFILAASSTIVSCKDYESDDYQQVKYDMSNLDARMQDKVNELNERITNLTNDLNTFKQTACGQQHCKDAFNALTARIDSLSKVSKNHLTSANLADIENRLTTLEGKSDDLSWKDQIKDLKDQIKDLNDKLAGLTPGTSYDDTELRDKIDKLSEKITELTGKVDNAATKDELKAVRDNVDALLANDPKQDQAIKELQEKIKTMTGTEKDLSDLIDIINNTTIPNLKKDFQSKVDAANNAAKEAKDSADSYYNKALDAIAATNRTVGNLEQANVDMVAALLTDVIIQRICSPAVGEFALPNGESSNTLITYYGSSASSFQFPTNNPSYFYKAEEAEGIPAEALRGKTVDIKAGTLIDQDGAEGNAGKLYVSINPNTVDATGVQFALVNSQNKQSAVKLGQASASDRVLTFGYTRAAGNNFYEIPATITEDNLSQCTFNVERTGLRAAVKNLVNNRTQTKASIKTLTKEMAEFFFQNMNGVAPSLALSTSYKVGTNDKNRQQLNNVTKMSIMAGAFKPLGFGAFNSIHMETVPGLERVEKIISNFINSIHLNNVKVEGISNKTIDHVESIGQISKAAAGSYVITVTVKATDGSEATGTVDITDQINNLIGTINDETVINMDDAVAKFNSAIDAYNDIISEINGGVTVDLSSQKASAISKIYSYLDKVNGRFTYWFNRVVGASLDPCMLFFGADGNVHRLISGNAGVRVKGSSIRLVPTTYTYELLAPAYKKFITVTNANLSGTNLGKVISGDTREVTITGLQPGKTYNILYEAVDYNGKVSARQYKINVE
jgi:predicted  nucleic acid-binding Zn-ribbon protein